jgi:hypothetical protein
MYTCLRSSVEVLSKSSGGRQKRLDVAGKHDIVTQVYFVYSGRNDGICMPRVATVHAHLVYSLLLPASPAVRLAAVFLAALTAKQT